MSADQLINFYGMARTVSLVILIAGAALAVFMFFRNDIRTIYGIRSGKAQQKMVQQMNDQNMLTGQLRREIDYGETTDGLLSGETGAKSGQTGRSSRFGRSERTARNQKTVSGQLRRPPQHSGHTGIFQEEGDYTASMTADEAGYETTALNDQPAFVLTEHIMVIHTSEEI